MPIPEHGSSVVTFQDDLPGTTLFDATGFVRISVESSLTECPAYWSVQRDNWLQDFVKLPGNDLLSGCISTLIARVVSTGFYLEGPLPKVLLYRSLFLHPSQYSKGWMQEISQVLWAYFTRDSGGVLELLRSSANDHTGPCLGIRHVDETKCLLTGEPDYPLLYLRDGKYYRIPASSVLSFVDMPDPRDFLKGVGFCATSRAIVVASILRDLARYKRERLSDLPPAGIAFINNMTPSQWEDVKKQYESRQRSEGNTTWRDLMVAFGLDPAYQVNVELLELSRLPEHYDERTATEIAIYSFALAFRVDPREYWPVSSGPLGTATEAEIQHRKAKSKGEGIIFTMLERAFGRMYALPENVTFRFDFRDDEEDAKAAEINSVKIQNIRRLWEASPNRVEGEDVGLGIISTEEARQLLVHWGVIPPELLGQAMTFGKDYDIRSGPRARAYSDGRVLVLR